MAGRNGNAQLQSDYDQAMTNIAEVKSTLEEAYTPEATRGDLAAAVGAALEVLSDYEVEDEDEDSGGEDDE